MRAVSRLSINTLAGRRSRTALLAVAVALSASLVSAMSCALASLNAGMDHRIASSIGRADVQVRHVAQDRFDARVLDRVRGWKEVAIAAPRSREAVRLRSPKRPGKVALVSALGVDPALEHLVTVIAVDEGRAVEGDGEILLGRSVAESLGVGVGDEVFAGDGKLSRPLRVVGVTGKKVIEMVSRPSAMVSLGTLREVTGVRGALHSIGIILREGDDAEAVVALHGATMPTGILVRATVRVTSGISGMMRANRLLFILTSMLSYIGSAVIVLTGLTTNVLERQRELAVLRCIGATRLQLGLTQLSVGGVLGVLGAAVGVPLGVGLAWALAAVFPERLPAGLTVWPTGLGIAGIGAIVAGLVGGAWPAWSASRSRPLAALASRARPYRRAAIVWTTAAGLSGVALGAILMGGIDGLGAAFWVYAAVGVPTMFVGYMLLGVPLVAVMARFVAPLISRALGLPRLVLAKSVGATPFRHGFTAGALMVGLALMTSVYINGRAIMHDWLDTIHFPDAFVNGLLVGLTPEAQRRIEGLDFVEETCAITIMKAQTGRKGLLGFGSGRRTKNYFFAFEPDPFFAMTELYWQAGDEANARRRLDEGGAVLVSIGWARKREGVEIGDTIVMEHAGRDLEFELAGVVSAAGLELVRRHFEFEEDFAEYATNAVFGTRADLKRLFGSEAIHLIQIGLSDEIGDEEAVTRIKAALNQPGYIVGSGKQIKASINAFGTSIMRVATVVAIGAMLIGCAGVVSVVIAGVDARRFEFGVLRAVGAERGMLARLVVGEVLIVALAACVLGTAMGLQSSVGSLRVYNAVLGTSFKAGFPVGAIAGGWALLIGLTLGSVSPVVWRLMRAPVRELLFSTRG